MDQLENDKALNILVPQLIKKNQNLTKEIKRRIQLNKIFSEFENKASTEFNFFITNSSQRYNCTKLGNDLNYFLSKNRTKNINRANKILNDKFYSDKNLEKEKEKFKYKSTSKLHKDIKDSFNNIKLQYKFNKESKKKIKFLINKIKNNKDNNIKNLNNYNNNREKLKNEKKEKNETENKIFNIPIKKENMPIRYTISKYLNIINNNLKLFHDCKTTSYKDILNTTNYKEKHHINLPDIKTINFIPHKTVRKQIKTDENSKKPDITKLLPYSKMGKLMKNSLSIKKIKKRELSSNDIENNYNPFLTETNIPTDKINDFRNTVKVVYNSANKELHLQKNIDRKRRKINDLFGIDNVPQLTTYDDIIFKTSGDLKTERLKKREKINNSQIYESLSTKEKGIYIINNEIKRLNDIEKNVYNKLNIIKIKEN